MAEIMKCPVCGGKNPSDMEFCQYCQSRLHPLAESPSETADHLSAGQIPTQKDTGELEPMLPQWLRDARNSAQGSFEEDTPQSNQQPPGPRSILPGEDLLAGLSSQAQDDNEDEVPDWLTSITGESPKPKKAQPEAPDMRWVELGGKSELPKEEPVADTPSWLTGLSSSPAPSQPDEKDELANWFQEVDDGPKSQQPSQPASFVDNSKSNPPSDAAPDWLRAMAAESDSQNEKSGDTSSASFDTPDWLRAMAVEDGSQAAEPDSNAFDKPTPTSSADMPDWFPAAPEPEKTFGADSVIFSEPALGTSDADMSRVDDNVPDWLKGFKSEEPAEPSSNVPDWLTGMQSESPLETPSADIDWLSSSNEPIKNIDEPDAPDWLRGMQSETPAETPSAELDWLSPEPAKNVETPAESSSDVPDWLKGMQSETPTETPSAELDWLSAEPAKDVETPAESSSDVPDWLRGMQSETPTETPSAELDWLSAEPVKNENAPAESPSTGLDWLKDMESETSAETPSADEPAIEAVVPAWLSGAPISEPVAFEEDQPLSSPQDDEFLGDVPSWLKAAAPQSSIFGESSPEQTPKPNPPVSSSDTPDWLNTFKESSPQPVSAFKADETNKPVSPAFIDDSETGGSSEALFTEMPDWLSNVDVSPLSSLPKASSSSSSNNDEGAIAPGELPSWVQAMRPVDSSILQAASDLNSTDQTLESRGALAGLQGVLPAVPGFRPTSKPKTYSIKLQTSEEQEAHAALLEQILSAETEPVPLTSFSKLATSRVLRWSIALVLVLGVFAVLFLRTQIFMMPVGIPFEISDAVNVSQSIPEGAPVLVVFDYEPARAGEMETAATPMFDRMILLRHPKLTFISTNETGPILAERFISGPLAGHNYKSGSEYVNLGYLPGGQMGIRAFVQDPRRTTEFAFGRNPTSGALIDSTLTSAWMSEPWSGITSFSQFTAMIIISDNADTSRGWLEQTSPVLGGMPVVVISSAQASPMLYPYYASKQISGLVSGIYGGALFEQNNAGRPSKTRTYWDAYSIGMLLAMVMILVGGLSNLVLGLRDRAVREGK